MRRLLLLVVSVASCIQFISAQITETTRAKAGENISGIISPTGVYRFPSFITGIYLKNDGLSSSAKMNYNLLTGEMQYLGLKGDTLVIANASEINLIKIQGITFYSRDGYKEVIVDHDSLKLAVEPIIKLEYEKVGLYGQSNGAQDVVNVNTYSSGTDIFQLTLGQDAVIRKKTTYYLFNKNESPVIATKKSFLKIFNKNRPAVSRYIEEKKVNFNSRLDLEKLLAFSSQQN